MKVLVAFLMILLAALQLLIEPDGFTRQTNTVARTLRALRVIGAMALIGILVELLARSIGMTGDAVVPSIVALASGGALVWLVRDRPASIERVGDDARG